ncbi:MAG: hypothetical protein WC043_05575 [Pseudobdellovibrionaceae bacterium]
MLPNQCTQVPIGPKDVTDKRVSIAHLAGIGACFTGVLGGGCFAVRGAWAGGFKPDLALPKFSGLFLTLFGRPFSLFTRRCHGG